uniref:beta-parvin n=1 Tax=Ictidomys tridecemlineatus TaxID=43179 RepID=UPI001A9D9428|nr:beta-parvin [Ictidomys tridecemlineatus]
MHPASVDIHPEDTQLEENEERTMIDPTSREDPKFKELVKVLLDWVNDVLVEDRIIVKQLEEDLYDGQVLQKLLEKLADRKLNVAEVTQSEIGQKQKLQTVLDAVLDLLRPHGWALRWSVDSIHGKNLVAILHLLIALATHFRAPIRLPEHVSVQVVVVRKREGLLHSSHVSEELTSTTEWLGAMAALDLRSVAQAEGDLQDWVPPTEGDSDCLIGDNLTLMALDLQFTGRHGTWRGRVGDGSSDRSGRAAVPVPSCGPWRASRPVEQHLGGLLCARAWCRGSRPPRGRPLQFWQELDSGGTGHQGTSGLHQPLCRPLLACLAERDAFDTLFDHAPDKLNLVKKSLITFVNKQLNKLNLEVTELETQFADGVYLVLLMGLLEDYFVPLHNFYLTPESFDQKVHNVSFAFELMLDGGLRRPKARPEDVVNLDLKSTLRVLYNLFTKYKNVE